MMMVLMVIMVLMMVGVQTDHTKAPVKQGSSFDRGLIVTLWTSS